MTARFHAPWGASARSSEPWPWRYRLGDARPREAARTSSGSGTRHRRCRCCLPALTGFTTSRRGEADASHHRRARDG